MLKKRDIFSLFFINLIIFFSIAAFSKINCEVVLKNPQFQSYTVNIGHKKINTDVLNEELLEIKLPYGVSEFSINGINKHQITNIFLDGNEITSPDEISSNLLKLKIKMLFKVFGLSFAGLLLEIILAALFFIPQKDKFWENLKNNKSVFYISCLILAVFILWNFYNVFQNAVDLPFWDEWEALLPGHLDKQINYNWLLSFHNEHKIFWTRLFSWILYNFDGWNLRHQIILNFFLYLASMFVLYKIIPDKNSLLPLFFIPCFSDVLIENQMTGFQSVFYFMLLFSFLAIYFGFVKENNVKNTLLFSIFAVCSMFSMTFISGIALFAAFIIKQHRINKNLIIAGCIIFTGLIIFFSNYKHIDVQMEITTPDKLLFWYYYLRVILKGIFNVYLPAIWTMIAGILMIGGFVMSYIREKDKNDYYVYLALILLSLFLVAGIAAGRASGDPFHSVAGRHLNVINYLIPCISALLMRFNYIKAALIYFLILVFGFSSCYSFKTYISLKEFRVQAKRELLMVINTKRAELTVGKVNPFDIKKCITRAKELNVSFLREM